MSETFTELLTKYEALKSRHEAVVAENARLKVREQLIPPVGKIDWLVSQIDALESERDSLKEQNESWRMANSGLKAKLVEAEAREQELREACGSALDVLRAGVTHPDWLSTEEQLEAALAGEP